MSDVEDGVGLVEVAELEVLVDVAGRLSQIVPVVWLMMWKNLKL